MSRTTKVLFNNFNSSVEQNLYDSIFIESIAMHGMDMYYIPKIINNRDNVLNEDTISSYEQWWQMPFYLENQEAFAGQGDFLSKFGLEIRDQITLSVARKIFAETMQDQQLRPNEGDLLYFPLNKKIFVIRFVEHEQMFYQFGKLNTWQLKCELFEYSGEKFATGIPEIDLLEAQASTNFANFGILSEDEYTIIDETGFPIAQDFRIEDQDFVAQNDIFQEEGEPIVDLSEQNSFVDIFGDRYGS